MRQNDPPMRWYYLLVGAFALVSLPLAGDAWPFVLSHWIPLVLVLPVVGALAIVRERIRGDRGRAWLTEYRDAAVRCRPLARLRHAAPALVLYPVVIGCYVGWRLWLNRHVPFTWDARLAGIEGQRASEWLVRAFAEWPPLYRAVEVAYGSLWLVFTLGMMTYVAFQPASRERTRYFVTLALVFPLAGNVASGLLMSAGPVYYRHVVCGPDVYAPTVALLDRVSTWMRPGQLALWSLHSRHSGFPSTGVTAAPSMHVVVATLAACWWWAQGRRAIALGAVTFTVLGSVVTGWHYWLDGVIAIVLTIAIWLSARLR